jgi:Arc/MetJ-type ribon-helix-helix transcriptional regulator
MTLTVRLPEELETQLREKLQAEDIKASDFVRAAIAEKLAREPVKRKLSPYELGKDVFGCYELGGPDDSSRARRKELIGEALDAKHARRQRSPLRPVQQKRPASR